MVRTEGLSDVLLTRYVAELTARDFAVAPSSMAAPVALARRVDRLRRLKAKIEYGAIGFETATLLTRVASHSTEAAWLALADISTTKIFREHVDAIRDAQVVGPLAASTLGAARRRGGLITW